METLLLNIENKEKAEALKQILNELSFVSEIKLVKNKSALKEALEEHEEMKKSVMRKKNKAIAKYL